ncbi:DNA polymerase III subunit delta [Gammaproteobacteria bacterium]
MRLYLEQLDRHLTTERLAPIYLFSGDETLLVEEAGDRVRAAARQSGCVEREVLHAVQGFDWRILTRAGANLSLFAARRLLELRLPTGKPGTEGTKTLVALASHPPPDTVVLIFCPKMESATQKSTWVTSLDRAGVLVIIRTIESGALPAWITARMRSRGLIPDAEAVRLLAERVEGNLLAGVQEIEKLHLLRGAGPVDVKAVESAVADSAHFDVYALPDACLMGDQARAVRILLGLRGEGMELPIILWTLTRELRILAGTIVELERGRSVEQVLSGVWDRRRPIMIRALRRIGARRSEALLQRAAQVDRYIKGSLPGDPWGGMLDLVLGFSSTPIDSIGNLRGAA